ncbi:hypothetical protein N8703_00170 [Verrucomicrobia bacterium]|nr:hypothetical protein [Verrucomicrobiota bacterium]
MLRILIVFLMASSYWTGFAGWQAYNDSSNKNGGTIDPNVTQINVGRGSPGPNEEELLIHETGASTGVTVRYEETLSTGSVFWTSDAITYDAESDAARLFDGILDLEGNISYGDAPGWHVDLIIEGLDPERTYTFAGTAMRGGGEGYSERTTNWRILGAEGFVYASSQGAWKVGEDSVEFSTGHNEAGLVARWTGIQSGPDGQVILRTSHSVGKANGGLPGAHAYKGYAGGVFMLKLEDLPAPGWQAYNDSSNKNGGTIDPNVTQINVGRGSPGPNEEELLIHATGASTEVTVRYEETFSTGSVFWTSDAITYDAESDAARLFDGILDLEGNISYGDAPGWHVDLIIEGLDPERTYTFAGTAMRGGGEGYSERTTNWRILGAEGFVYASSQGAWKVGEDSVEFSTGHNEAGLVARWTGIQSGPDGQVILRTSHSVGKANGGLPGAHAYKGYAGGVFMLELESGGASQATGGQMQIVRLFPSQALPAHPASGLLVSVDPGNGEIDASSIEMFLDGQAVEVQLKESEGLVEIMHHPQSPFASGSMHTVQLSFRDQSSSPSAYESQWSFKVFDYAGLPRVAASEQLSGFNSSSSQAGFAVRTAVIDPFDSPAGEWVLEGVEDVLQIWEKPHLNLADLSANNSKGYYIESQQVNYQRDQLAIGNHGAESSFPGVSGSEILVFEGDEAVSIFFGCEITTILALDEGYHDFSITSSPIHELRMGFGQDARLMEPDASINPGNSDDQGWRYRFYVDEAGFYPFSLLFLDNLTGSSTLTTSGGSASSLEWSVKSAAGTTPLINSDQEVSIAAFIPPHAMDAASRPIRVTQINAHSFSFNAVAGSVYHVEGSEDLQQWQVLQKITADAPEARFEDEVPMRADTFFYRVVLP